MCSSTRHYPTKYNGFSPSYTYIASCMMYLLTSPAPNPLLAECAGGTRQKRNSEMESGASCYGSPKRRIYSPKPVVLDDFCNLFQNNLNNRYLVAERIAPPWSLLFFLPHLLTTSMIHRIIGGIGLFSLT
jgi:hypothetical protein